MSETLSKTESLALKVGRPAELVPNIEEYRQAILHPDPDYEFYPDLKKPKPLKDGLTNELQIGQMRRFLAACGDDAATGGANFKELIDQLDGDPIALAAYLVFPDQRDLREELIKEMILASTSLNGEKKDYLIISPQGKNENNLLEFGLEKMAWDRQGEKPVETITIKDDDKKVITDSQGQELEFFLEERNGEPFLVLEREIVPAADADPETNYSFKTLADFQKALNAIVDRYPPPENNLKINLRSGALVVRLDKITGWILCAAKNASDLAQELSIYPEGVVQPTNWSELFERFGWESRPEPPPETKTEEKVEAVEKPKPDDDIILF